MSLDQNIRGALQVSALAVPGMPPQSQIAFENMVFSSTPGTPWARFTVSPAASRAYTVSARTKRHDGLFLIDLFVPANAGTAAIETLGSAVRDALAAATTLSLNGVVVKVDYAERSKAMEQKPDWLMCAVTIGWHCFSTSN